MKFLKNLKKTLILSGALVSGAIGLANSGAYAASNYGDTPFSFIFDSFNTSPYDITENREKWDDSSSYMHADYVGDRSKSDYTYMAYVEKDTGINLDNGGAWRQKFDDGDSKFIFNNAYEKYGYGVLVHIRAEKGWNVVNVGAAGMWSPDSI